MTAAPRFAEYTTLPILLACADEAPTEAATSDFGTFETCLRSLRMSANRGGPEVSGARSSDAIEPFAHWHHHRSMRHIIASPDLHCRRRHAPARLRARVSLLGCKRGRRSLPVKWWTHASAARFPMERANGWVDLRTSDLCSCNVCRGACRRALRFCVWPRCRVALALHSFPGADRNANLGVRADCPGLLG